MVHMPPAHKTVRTVLCAQSLWKKQVACMRTDTWVPGAERAWQVKEGQAVAYVAYSKAYVDEEESAAAAKKGVWSARGFEKPWDYRKARKAEGRVRLCPALMMTVTPAPMTVTAVHAVHPAPCCQEGVGSLGNRCRLDTAGRPRVRSLFAGVGG